MKNESIFLFCFRDENKGEKVYKLANTPQKMNGSSMDNKKSPPIKSAGFLRYLADSNRRPRFCRPIPNHSGKVPFCGCKDTTFF